LLENIYWTDTCDGSWNRYVIFVAYEDIQLKETKLSYLFSCL
jgi:ribulose 1,5-bisphosphate carboxylase large subunit-like protein